MYVQITPPWTRRTRRFAITGIALGLSLAASFGQTAQQPTEGKSPEKNEDESVVVLSPFVVSTEKDKGYAAASTLAGTRLRTDLRDVATSITVITPEFLRDTGATDTEGLLTYVTGSEVAGPSGNISGTSIGGQWTDETAHLRSSRSFTRLRGLAAATESRNFFATSIPLDGYNVERIEINRGANSILFGTGSPAGIINSSLKQAQMRNAYEIETRYATFGSFRGSMDLNQQIIKGELAIRVASLYKDQKFEQDFAFEKDQRIYGAFTYDPKWARTRNGVLSGTVLRGNYESGQVDSRRPRTVPPTDRISGWFAPWFGAYPAKVVWDGGTYRTNTVINGVKVFPSPAHEPTYPHYRNPTVYFATPDSPSPGTGSFASNGAEIVGRQGIISNLPVAGAPAGAPLGTGFFASASNLGFVAGFAGLGIPDAGFYLQPSLMDTSVFDFRNKMIDGPNRFEYADFTAYNVVLEQLFFRNRAGIELSFDKQRYADGSSVFATEARYTELSIDINSTLMDGTPNPNFGRPFILGKWQNIYSGGDSRTFRATAFYRFDFADVAPAGWAKWLGKHTFTFLHEDGKSRGRGLVGNRFGTDNGYIYGGSQLVTDNNGASLTSLHYVGPSLATATSLAGAHIPGLTALQLPTASAGRTFQFRGQTAASQFVLTPLAIAEDTLIPAYNVTSANKDGIEPNAKAAVLQSRFLQDALVATIGWRRDEVDSFTAAAPRRGARNNLLVDDLNWPFPTAPSVSTASESISKSLVLHAPGRIVRRVPLVSSLSFRYNTSENFNPGVGARVDSNLDSVAPPAGTTKDYGFSLGLADDRVVIGATWFETSQAGVTASGSVGPLTRNIVETWRVFTNTTNQGLNPTASQVIAPPQALLDAYSFTVTSGSAAFVERPDIVLTQDFISKGFELESYVNLTRNWRLMLNVSRQQSTRSNTGAVFQELFFTRQINGQTLFENWSGPIGQANRVSEGGELLSSRALGIGNLFNNQALQDGGPARELRKWRVNLVTNYAFDHTSRLKGFSLGGGARWQDRAAIGFPPTTAPSGTRIPDVNNPFMGPEELVVDSWVGYERRIFGDKVKLTVKLNLFNVLGADDLIPVAVQPTGAVATYRIPSPRRVELTTRLEF